MTDAEPEPGVPTGNQLFDEAAEWFAAMRGPDADLRRSAFEAWLTRGAVHRSAYNRIAEIFTDSGRVEAQDSVTQPQIAPRERRARRLAPLAVIIGTGAAFAAIWFHARAPEAGAPARLEAAAPSPETLGSAAGEIRRIVLADGSVVTLDTESRVSVLMTERERRLRLIRGRARFAVAHDARPFRVFAGSGVVTAHGTIFDVKLGAHGKVSVLLLRGAVDVALSNDKRVTSQQLRPGQSTVFGNRFDRPRPFAATGADDWPATRKEFHDVALSKVVEEANRYALVPIELDGANVANLRVSGLFSIRDSRKLAEQIAHVFRLETATEPDRIVLRKSDLKALPLKAMRR